MRKTKPDATQIWKQMEDLVVPRLRLGVYEHIVYSQLVRHSRLEGRRRLHFSIPWLARALLVSVHPVRLSVRSLADKGALRIVERTRAGHVVEVLLPAEIGACHRQPRTPADTHLEAVNFLHNRELRSSIHHRENGHCFYCLRFLNSGARALDHVVPRAKSGRNSYRNLVSCCVECNSRKGERAAADYLRQLFRQNRLNATELDNRLRALKMLAIGRMKPVLASRHSSLATHMVRRGTARKSLGFPKPAP